MAFLTSSDAINNYDSTNFTDFYNSYDVLKNNTELYASCKRYVSSLNVDIFMGVVKIKNNGIPMIWNFGFSPSIIPTYGGSFYLNQWSLNDGWTTVIKSPHVAMRNRAIDSYLSTAAFDSS